MFTNPLDPRADPLHDGLQEQSAVSTELQMEHFLWLIIIGFVLGTIGTIIGAGGGFILMPFLLLLYPDAKPETITSISLAIVFFNAFSGSCAYARLKRIDYKSGLFFAAASLPGAIAGSLTTNYLPRQLFNTIFGVLMVLSAVYLLFYRTSEDTPKRVEGSMAAEHPSTSNWPLGMGLSFFVGYLSSLLGIGGGIVHVPILVRILGYSVHTATATSHFILAIMALTGTITHIAAGSFSHGGIKRTIFLGIGVTFGAQVGAWLSSHIHGKWILRGLAIALAFVGVRILILAFFSH
jgi:hypothetical protein